ncbi:MAG: trigger factor [Gammaproteobacteria bacterium HGW-Gammaproteobacteria-1]|jgi:trigger factor|nr:MAG: trigger factor [Gammaproteobacteria bacterium HGW-Gammaproteobacteria-1]
MQVSVETTSGLERRMTVQVPEERIASEVDNRLRQLARTTSIKGFRPGKVPFKMVQQRYAEQVRQEVLGDVIQSSYFEAVSQEKLRPAGYPSFEPKSLEQGKGMEYVATFEVMPEIELAGLAGVSIEKPVAEVTDADVDTMLDTLRKQNAGWTAAERAAADGDRVTIDFKGTIDGAEFQGNKGENVPVTLGGKRMIAGFEDGLVGAKAGEERTLDLQFPDNYGYKDVAGKPVQFKVSIKQVEEPQLPELDDAFAAKFGVEGGIDALRGEVRTNMERELEQRLSATVKQQVMDKLLEINNITVPQALVMQEAQALAQQMRENMQLPADKSGSVSPAMFEEQAKKRVTLGLLLAELVQRHNLKVDADVLRGKVEQMAAGYDQPEEVVKWFYADKRRLGEVESLALEEVVVAWVLGQVQVTEKPQGFNDLMNRA